MKTLRLMMFLTVVPLFLVQRYGRAADEADEGLRPLARPSVISVPSTSDDADSNHSLTALSSDDNEHPLGYGTPGVSLLGGAAIYRLANQTVITPDFAVRYYFPRRDTDAEGPEALSHWSAEIGGIVPKVENGSGDVDNRATFAYEVRTAPSGTYYVRTTAISEFHAAAQYQWLIRKPLRMVPQISLGLSVTKVRNEIDWVSADLMSGGLTTATQTSINPLFRAGLPIFANDWFALRMDLGYARFGDTFKFRDQTFKKTLSGIAFYPSVQFNIGYLRSAVQPGEYLQPNALPLWALSGMQTEHTSPVIATPEAVLNQRGIRPDSMLGNVLFQYKNRWARKVEVLGNFNHWKPEPMYMDKNHVWMTIKDLQPGSYRYTFLVNGHREIRDPWNAIFDASERPHGCSVFEVHAEYEGN